MLFLYLVDGKWSDFGDYEECSKSCGGGIMKRFRTCTNPAPAHGGEKCTGWNFNFKVCNAKPCPGDLQVSTTDAYLAPCQISLIECFCQKSQGLKAAIIDLHRALITSMKMLGKVVAAFR